MGEQIKGHLCPLCSGCRPARNWGPQLHVYKLLKHSCFQVIHIPFQSHMVRDPLGGAKAEGAGIRASWEARHTFSFSLLSCLSLCLLSPLSSSFSSFVLTSSLHLPLSLSSPGQINHSRTGRVLTLSSPPHLRPVTAPCWSPGPSLACPVPWLPAPCHPGQPGCFGKMLGGGRMCGL